VTFVILEEPAKEMAVCHMVRRHYDEGRTAAVLTDDAAEADALMTRLWTFSQRDFIPHELAGASDGIEVDRVLLAAAEGALPEADVLVLAAPCSGEAWKRYGTLVDFAEVYDEDRRRAALERLEAYRAAGLRIRRLEWKS
jgi:DNA polymerase-3 subunit chi